ncbi:hypothetical protein [uncultured Algibacter sp.]|uniref:hypothetical protein n=1 Tax=uncultured Algibacter sp. TaxID=298659 RepID=UPI002617C1F9|nr:hypothetical protein [uncultured Algibacter sp.]
MMDCIPIYWGNKQIDFEFNSKRFIKSIEELSKRIKEIECNPDIAIKMLQEPIFAKDRIDYETEKMLVLERIINVIESKKRPIAKTYRPYVYMLLKKYIRFKQLLKRSLNKSLAC